MTFNLWQPVPQSFPSRSAQHGIRCPCLVISSDSKRISFLFYYNTFLFDICLLKKIKFKLLQKGCKVLINSLFSFLFFFIYFYQLKANYFTILQWFLSYIDMNQPWIYTYSASRSPLPPPSLSNPSGSSQCTRPKHLSHASNLGQWSVSLQKIYMFRCCSLETSHPHLLPQSPKVCYVHLCRFFYFAYKVIITIFLNSIYMCQYDVMFFIFLAYFTLHNGLQFHPSHQN